MDTDILRTRMPAHLCVPEIVPSPMVFHLHPIVSFARTRADFYASNISFHSVTYGCLEENNMRLKQDGKAVDDKKDVCLPPQSYWVRLHYYSWGCIPDEYFLNCETNSIFSE